jgi:hypothetical protein
MIKTQVKLVFSVKISLLPHCRYALATGLAWLTSSEFPLLIFYPLHLTQFPPPARSKVGLEAGVGNTEEEKIQ